MGVRRMSKENKNQPKKKSFLQLLLLKLFGRGKEKLSVLEEEQMIGPIRTIFHNFRNNKLAMTGFSVFILIFVFVIIGPIFFKLDLSYTETSQKDVAPGLNMLEVPDTLQGKVADISVGPTYTIAISTDGQIYIWGKTKVTRTIDLSYVPSGMGKLVNVAAGFDHVLALNEEGKLYSWGSDRQQQVTIPKEVADLTNIKDIYAGYQCSVVLTEDGRSFFFGNQSNNDYKRNHNYQGQLDKIALTSDAVLGLTFDGEAVFLGKQSASSYSKQPEIEEKVVDISASASTMAALSESGKVYVWGNLSERGEGKVPQTDSKIVDIEAGRYHYTAKLENGDVVAWGFNNYKQATVPVKVNEDNVETLYTGFYQNYAITTEGKIIPWGLKGYLLGSDDLGRDILSRLVNGGRMSMTIGAVSVIISTIIGVVVGCVSGFFGGKVDLILQRLVEIISSLPFLPFIMILSSLIGNKMTSNQRIYLMMIILGLLQWPGLSRLVRAQVFAEREKEFVTAAKAVGVKQMSIVFKHILPNVISVIIVSATLDFATCMLTEATLSYLGFGVPAPQPTWGNMLFGCNNSIIIQNYWWRWVFTSLILGICVICINLTGDGLRDAIDPKSQER